MPTKKPKNMAPALTVDLLRGGRMATMNGQKSLATGLAGGLVGVACSTKGDFSTGLEILPDRNPVTRCHIFGCNASE